MSDILDIMIQISKSKDSDATCMISLVVKIILVIVTKISKIKVANTDCIKHGFILGFKQEFFSFMQLLNS